VSNAGWIAAFAFGTIRNVSLTPDAEQVLARLDRVQELIDELVKAKGDLVETQDLVERIRRELLAARTSVRPYDPFGPSRPAMFAQGC